MEQQDNQALKILVVDDNQDSRELVIKVLQKEAVQLFEAIDGKDALEKVEQARPNIILMDISLPKIDGYEVTRRLKNSTIFSSIPIIALTAHAMKGDKEKALAAGCDGYISKPINIHGFYERVTSFVH